jgi:HlyD family secretion protein
MSDLDGQLNKLKIDKNKKRRRNGGGHTRIIAVVVLIIAVGGYALYARHYRAVPVKTAHVERETVIEGKGTALLTASGYIVPCQRIEVSSMLIARVKELLVKRGDTVKAGDVLIRLEDAEYQARVRAAESQVETLRARLAELRAGSRPQEIDAAKAGVAAGEATLRNAELEFDRIEKLRKQGAISEQDMDRARSARDVARAKLDADRKTADLVRIGPRAEQINAVQAQLQQAGEERQYAQTMLDYTVIRAPIDGVILEKLAEQGELVTNTNFGGTRGAKSSVVAMADLRCLEVEIDLNESDLAKVHLQQACEIRLDSQPDRVYDGVVEEISPQADRQKGTVQTKVRMVNPEESIKTEVNARVTFVAPASSTTAGAQAKPRMWVPKNAVVDRPGGMMVFTVVDDDALAKKVKVQGETDRGVEILEGLDGSETIIADPAATIKDGTRVRVTP